MTRCPYSAYLVLAVVAACGDTDPVNGIQRTQESPTTPEGGERKSALVRLPLEAKPVQREVEALEPPPTVSPALPVKSKLRQKSINVSIRALATDADQALELVLLSIDSPGLPPLTGKRGSASRWDWTMAKRYGTPLDVAPDWSGTGRTVTSDTHLVLPGAGAKLFARLGTKVTSARTRPVASNGTLTLDLTSGFNCVEQVIVEGVDGRPLAGVPVLALNSKIERRWISGMALATAGETNERGEVELGRKQDGEVGAVVWGRPLALGDDRKPSRIRLPAVGTVHVHLRSPESESKLDSMPASSEPKAEIQLVARPRYGRPGSRLGEFATERGELSLFPVATAERLSLVVSTESSFAEVEFETPARDGEEIDVIVPLQTSRFISFELVDPSGAPLPKLRCSVSVDQRKSRAFRVRTDKEGRATVTLHGSPLSRRIKGLYVQERDKATDPEDGRFGMLVVPEAEALAADLGTIVLSPVRAQFGGHVVDQHGAPIDGGAVVLMQRLGPAPDSLTGNLDPFGLLRPTSRTEVVETTYTDEFGAFSLGIPGGYVHDPDRPLLIQASDDGVYTVAPQPVQAGDMSVLLSVVPPGSISFDTSGVDPKVWNGLRLTLEHEECEDYYRETSHIVKMGSGGRHHVRLAPGRYTVYGELGGVGPKPIIRDILVHPGQSTPKVSITGEGLAVHFSAPASNEQPENRDDSAPR